MLYRWVIPMSVLSEVHYFESHDIKRGIDKNRIETVISDIQRHSIHT